MGAVAIDKDNDNISEDLVIDNNVNVNVEGEYTVTYKVSDSIGRRAIPVVRNVKVNNTLSITNQEIHDIQIFPNPTKNKLNINSKYKINKITIINLLGKKVIEKTSLLNYVNLNKLPKGVYILKIDFENGILNKKIIKE